MKYFIIILLAFLLQNCQKKEIVKPLPEKKEEVVMQEGDYEGFLSFGPIWSFSSNDIRTISVSFFTFDEEISGIDIKSPYTNFRVMGNIPAKFHIIKMHLFNRSPFTYKLVSEDSKLKGFSDKLNIPYTRFNFSVFGDVNSDLESLKKLSSVMSRYDSIFIANTGKMVSDSYNNYKWYEFFNTISNLVSKNFFVAVNSDKHKKNPNYKNMFINPIKDKQYYALEFPFMKLFILDTEDEISENSEQINWFKEELNKTEDLWKIVIFNKPPYSSTSNRNESYTKRINSILCPIMEKNKVHFVINGNDNLYERYKMNGIMYITIGSGNTNFSKAIYDSSYRIKLIENRLLFLNLDVQLKTIRIRAIDDNNNILDEFTLEKDLIDMTLFRDEK